MAEVGITELRRTLKDWVDRVRSGDEVIVTDRGRAVARLTSIEAAPLIDRLVAAGRVSRPTGAERPRASRERRIRADGEVSALVTEARDARR
ncbi:MAG: type II toxin-antitoxin system prevent-host-death family antitoxin [Dehalococcoidia bacterium]|nr:type II toxin-antitoxin system prevent-host-death family antitoxin [Dehalococcoidia bacterium]